MLTEEERHALQQITVRTGIGKFAAMKQQQMDACCADAMRSVPRQVELAADYAAKAEAYKLLTLDLERFAESA